MGFIMYLIIIYLIVFIVDVFVFIKGKGNKKLD